MYVTIQFRPSRKTVRERSAKKCLRALIQRWRSLSLLKLKILRKYGIAVRNVMIAFSVKPALPITRMATRNRLTTTKASTSGSARGKSLVKNEHKRTCSVQNGCAYAFIYIYVNTYFSFLNIINLLKI